MREPSVAPKGLLLDSSTRKTRVYALKEKHLLTVGDMSRRIPRHLLAESKRAALELKQGFSRRKALQSSKTQTKKKTYSEYD
jgi:predicted component of type VI protein secretion system